MTGRRPSPPVAGHIEGHSTRHVRFITGISRLRGRPHIKHERRFVTWTKVGVPIEIVQLILGHSSPTVTRRIYAYVMKKATAEQEETASQLITKNSA
jgi:integrase